MSHNLLTDGAVLWALNGDIAVQKTFIAHIYHKAAQKEKLI